MDVNSMPTPNPSSGAREKSDESLKLAVAMSLLRQRKLHQPASDALSGGAAVAKRWRKKAKARQREIQRLREEIKQLEDGMQPEVVQQIASCRCYFFDSIGSSGQLGADGEGGQQHWIDDVLRRRFMRLVRLQNRRKADVPAWKKNAIEFNNEDEIDRLSMSIDFLVEHCSTREVDDSSFATLSHQAVDFILASLKKLLSLRKDDELIEEIVNGLIMRLTRRMCIFQYDGACSLLSSKESSSYSSDLQGHIQHLLRKLGSESFVGQRVILSVSQQVSIQAESLLFMDPFDDHFFEIHDNLFMMIQLLELLILDYVRSWVLVDNFDFKLLEEWVRSILQTCKALRLLESRNGLYILYMDRVTGHLARLIAPLARQWKLDPEILSNLFADLELLPDGSHPTLALHLMLNTLIFGSSLLEFSCLIRESWYQLYTKES